MRLELKDQRDIILSLKAQGGYGKKWASAFQVGNPDLICSLPGVGGFLMEVKSITLLEKEHIIDIDISPKLKHEAKQRYELQQWNQAGMVTCIGVVIHHKKMKGLAIVPVWIRSFRDLYNLNNFKTMWWGEGGKNFYNIIEAIRISRRGIIR